MAASKTVSPDSKSDQGNDDIVGEIAILEAQANAHYSRLGWKRLTVVVCCLLLWFQYNCILSESQALLAKE
jgi:hypothetical protein